MQQHWLSKMNGKGVGRLAKLVILLAASLAALSLMMPDTGAKGRRASSERDASLVSVMLEPSNPLIFGAHITQTLIVTGKYTDGSLRDLTRQAAFTSSDPAVATVDPSGTVKAIKNGQAWITAKVGRLSARQAVRIQLADQKRAISFVNDVAPIFARLGCSNSNCHGALNGQNGFKLSLFGYEPETDYKAVVEASDGRRINRAEPAKSLILLKPTQSVRHGGGKRFEPGSLEYHALKDWIEAGAPAGGSNESKMVRLEVMPRERVLLNADAMQQLVVLAHYADGTTFDVTRKVRYQSNDESIATVSADGLVAAKRSGEAAILVRSLDQVAAARIGVVLSPPVRNYPNTPLNNFIDELVFGKLKRLNIVPSEVCTDEEFLRRAHLDLIGVLPTAEEARKFLASRAPNKRAQLVDELL
ncbi:MAG: Ig-like domain-containing protein, partial [Blastocatellia bacterium]